MPNARNRIKQTGDTHLPDVGDEGSGGEDTLRYEPAEDTGPRGSAAPETAATPGRTRFTSASANAYVDAAREQIRQRPVVALASAFALGYLFARI